MRKSEANTSSDGGKDPGKTPVDYPRLIAAWRADFWGAIGKMIPHVSVDSDEDPQPVDEDPQPVDERANFDLIQNTIGLVLEYLILDIDTLSHHGGEAPSLDFGFSCLSDSALRIFLENREDENDFNRLPGDLEQNLVRLRACIIALIAAGDLESASKLLRMTDELLWIHGNLDITGMLKPGYDKMLGPEKQQIKLLVGLASMLQEGNLPTRKALRIELFGNKIDAGNFSRLLKGLKVAKFIPRESTRPKDPNASTFLPIKPLSDGLEQRKECIKLIVTKGRYGTHDKNLSRVKHHTAPNCSIKPSGNPEMAHCEIRRIRESLGAAYWQLLIQFGMGELESYEDLSAFVENLASIGLELK